MKKSQIKFLFLSLLSAASAMPLFADIVPAGMTNVANSIHEFFKGPIMITIVTCILIGCAVAYAYSKDNEKMKKSMIAIGISVIVIACAGGIVSGILSAAGN